MSQQCLLESFNQPLSVGGSPANHSVVPESKKEKMITDTSGPKCSALLESYSPNGLWGRMSQALLKSLSMTSSIVSKRKDTPRKHTVIQFRCSEPVIRGKGYLLLHTPSSQESGVTVERLQTKDGNPATVGERAYDKQTGRLAQVGLTQQIQMLPTLTTQEVEHKELNLTETGRRLTKDRISMIPTCTQRDYKDTGNLENVPEKSLLPRVLGKSYGLKLQPAFAEWMMGFPNGWTALDASEIVSSRSKSIRSSK